MRKKVFIIFFLIFVLFPIISNIDIVQAQSFSTSGQSQSSNTNKGKTITNGSTNGSTNKGSNSSAGSTSTDSGTSLSDVISGGDSFISDGKEGSAQINKWQLEGVSSGIYNILLICGVIVAVIIASVLGIKFMLGSVEEKADIKAAMVPFIIGCVVVFGAFGIWKIVVTIGNNF